LLNGGPIFWLSSYVARGQFRGGWSAALVYSLMLVAVTLGVTAMGLGIGAVFFGIHTGAPYFVAYLVASLVVPIVAAVKYGGPIWRGGTNT
jgi:hypothetical protein